MVPPFGQHCDIHNHLQIAFAVSRQSVRAICLTHITPDHARGNARTDKAGHDIPRMLNGRAKYNGLTVSGFFFPVLNHRIIDGARVHDVSNRAHIIIKSGFTDFTKFFLNTDIHDKGTWRHKVTGSDQLFDRDLVRHVGEDRAQTFFITTVRRGGHAQQLHVWIDVLSVLNHPHIAVSPGVMCFINH